jgi:signal transduction histidine kinase
MPCPRCHQDNPPQTRFCPECGTPLSGAVPAERFHAELLAENENLNRSLTEALEQQTATADILRVISSSPTDTEPVFDAIAANAARLCNANDAQVLRLEGEVLHLVAASGATAMPSVRPLTRGNIVGRAVLDRETVHVPTLAQALAEYAETTAGRYGVQSILAVPLLRKGVALGVIRISRTEEQPFSDKQITLLQTFADQAVIAIENVRLFKELQASNNDLTKSLDQQTATAEILRSISTSVTEVQPVFETIVKSGVRLLGGYSATMVILRDDQLDLVAYTSTGTEGDASLRQMFPIPLRSMPPAEQAVREGRTYVLDDVNTATDVTTAMRETIQARGWRSALFVPMLRDDAVVGLINVTRRASGAFAPDEIALLETFAAQAVIAIENARLFRELEARNRDLTEALDQQTATSEILRVISRSQTDVQPVFDAILGSAVRLLRAQNGTLTQRAGDQVELAALVAPEAASDAAGRARFPRPVQSAGAIAIAIRERRPINMIDVQVDPRAGEDTRAFARAAGLHSVVSVPMLRHGEAIGAIALGRREPGGFTDDEIALLQTFADQAVIAIENARLLAELQARTHELTRSVEQLTALGDVGRAVSSSLDLETVLTTIVSRAVQLSGLDGGVVFEYDEGADEFVQRAATEQGGELAAARRTRRIRRGEGVVGQTAVTLEPTQVSDILPEGAYESPLRGNLVQSGIRALLAVPMLWEGRLIGSVAVSRNTPGDFPPATVDLLRTFATQSALAIQNARLYQEIAIKSRQLEAASQHKSEFLANMSHELRTPLNAIIGFSEVLSERMFGDLNEKQEEYLKDIYASGQHLLSLINDILDLSKVEAGRMELEVADFDLPAAIENALTLVRERAARRGITLGSTIDSPVGSIRADERKVKQVLLNLLSNALKFTPEGGRIDVRAAMNERMVEVSVADTGVGIAPEDQEKVFEEFQQVGTVAKKVEGTGLGLTLCRKFVELHGGRIWVKSRPGDGSTFTFTLPVRGEDERKPLR